MTPRIPLLDPRFRYVSAAATDVAATWKRFGFNPVASAERRHRAKQPSTDVQPEHALRHLRIAR